jgi:hypothetical protein
MPLLTDGVRAPDRDNPRCHFEFELVKRTRKHPSWLPAAIGKAPKMVTKLLGDALPELDYRESLSAEIPTRSSRQIKAARPIRPERPKSLGPSA